MKALSVLPTLKKDQWDVINSNGVNTGSYDPLNWVVMDNVLIQSVHNLNNIDQKLFEYLISLIDLKKPTLEIKAKKIDIIHFIFPETKNKKSGEFNHWYYRRVSKAFENIIESGVFIKFDNKKGKMGLTRFVFIEHDDIEYILIKFTQELFPFLCYLKGNFTKYRIGYISKFKGKYSICLYKYFIMKSNIRKNNKKIVWQEDLKDLRFILAIQEKHKEFSNLKKYVFEPAIKEINKHTDIQIEYDVIRGGIKNREIMAIEFKAKKKYKETAIEKANNKAQFPKEVFSKDQDNLEEVAVVKTNTKKGDKNRNKNNNDNICNPVNNNGNHAVDVVIDMGNKEQKEEITQKKKISFFKKVKKMLLIYKDM